MKVTFHFNGEACMACGACAVACMDQNDIDLAAGQTPMRRVFTRERAGQRAFYSVGCMHCEDAPCAAVCPTGCLYRDAETGLTLYDADKCVGCHRCASACVLRETPVLTFERVGGRDRVKKCDGCIERLRGGLEPACVRVCPVGALSCRTEEM